MKKNSFELGRTSDGAATMASLPRFPRLLGMPDTGYTHTCPG